MATLNQIIRKPRKNKIRLKKKSPAKFGGTPNFAAEAQRSSASPALEKNPQKKGVCIRLLTREPKKPNSAKRKIAKVKLSNDKIIDVFIPGEGHSLHEHGIVLIRGGRTKDLPGVKYKCIRNKFDLGPVINRKTSRSKYGCKR